MIVDYGDGIRMVLQLSFPTKDKDTWSLIETLSSLISDEDLETILYVLRMSHTSYFISHT